MLTAYVQKATGLPVADSNGYSDPFCMLYGVVGSYFYQFGETKIIERNLNPVWDENCQIPFHISFARISKLRVDVWDHDTLSSNDFLGYAEIEIDPSKFGQSIEYPLITKNANRVSKITITIKFDNNAITEEKKSETDQSYVTYLSYSPPISQNQSVNLRFYSYDIEKGVVLALPGYGTIEETGFELDIKATHYGPTGFTNVATIFPKKENVSKYILPICVNKGYRGIITLNICSCVKMPKTSEDNKNIRICMSPEQQIIKVFRKLSVYVVNDGTFCFGGILDISDNKSLNVNCLILNQKLQELLKVVNTTPIPQITQLLYGSPFCKFFGLESAFVHEIYHIIEFDHSRYDSILKLMTEILKRKTNDNSHIVKSLIEYGFMYPKDLSTYNSSILHRLHFLRALLENEAIDPKEIVSYVENLDIRYSWISSFYSVMFFAPEIEQINKKFFDDCISAFKVYFGSGHGEGAIKEFLSILNVMKADNWSQLKSLLKFGYAPNTIMASIINGKLESDQVLNHENIDSFINISIFDRIRGFSQKVTPLAYSLYYNCIESTKYILTLKPMLSATGVRNYSDYAIRGGSSEIIEQIIPLKIIQNGSLKTAIEFHNTLLYEKITLSLGIKKIQTLETLKTSISCGNIEIFNRFSAQISVLAGDNLETEYINSVTSGHINSVIGLIYHFGVSPTAFGPRGLMPLQIAVTNGDVGMVKQLLSFLEVLPCAISEDGNVPIMSAIESRNSFLVSSISFSPVLDPNFSINGKTPLMLASEIGNVKCVEAILNSPSFTANPYYYLDKKNKEGETALFIASKIGFSKIVEILLKSGCSKDIENNSGKKPIDIAKNKDVIELLK
ncbi:C2 domain containing protein [Trichomonas vaginalis G3]|uniref:C2 domain containing protein n=1 Tax=Trichomonas vaginalis (strain ATCC PRA-98 / G3) TaxID=412133 RepID=A2F388_TRIV3|nr:guanyl-nucleotide exchange factor protein [Trichomonas vaginalis G3]EAY00647.1 C2 domain containing protein [Trichomonas vaginalis G3]KAI5500015.1 guanyl-nucleotide exchange factor protein [Trichomonas vaginalis G3]|eukprot:XP_001313576.1 C2 domain containing protein [Trichomonas vaginalis G3]